MSLVWASRVVELAQPWRLSTVEAARRLGRENSGKTEVIPVLGSCEPGPIGLWVDSISEFASQRSPCPFGDPGFRGFQFAKAGQRAGCFAINREGMLGMWRADRVILGIILGTVTRVLLLIGVFSRYTMTAV